MRQQFGGNFAPNPGGNQGFLLVRTLPPNSSEGQKKRKGLYHNLVVSLAGIWDLLVLPATFSPKRPDAFS